MREIKNAKLITAEEAAASIRSGDRIMTGINGNVAFDLSEALWKRRNELSNITVISSLITHPISILNDREQTDAFSVVTPFLGPYERNAMENGRKVGYTSIHLSQLDLWFRELGRPTVAFLAVSPPDENGMVSFGPGGVCAFPYVLETADRVFLEIVENIPYVTGKDALYPVEKADGVIWSSYKLAGLKDAVPDEETEAISKLIVDEISDGSTIQLGIGGLSTAVGKRLREKNDLGIYTELFCSPMAELMKNGNVTNKYKGFMDGISVYSFSQGTDEMYEYLDHNPLTFAAPFDFVNDPVNIMKNRKMISINSAMSVNLFGEVAADAIGFRQQSAVGGQLDFVKGAQRSEGGKSFIALKSSFIKDGKRKSKICLDFPLGTPVSTPRSEVQYVVTEFGLVNLKALTVQDRARALISLAHPDFRDELTDQARESGILR